jgi:branched-chain amino acid transport system ATP-binding protein
MLLQINDLCVSYGAIQALQGLSLWVGKGEVVALIGSNGAGKTTLLRTISGLLKPTAGSIRLGERDLRGVRPDRIVAAGISHSPEGRQVFAHMSVRENLLLGAYQRNDKAEIKSDADKCYALFPVLAERRDQRAGTLSGGEQQMLAMGRALMARPKLLLLDEPSLGLAPLIVRKIFQIIREINAAGTTIFLVEQNAHMALANAHRGYVLQTGRVVKTAPAAELLADPEVKAAYLGG